MPAAKKKAVKKPIKKTANAKKGKRYTPKEKERLLAKYNTARAAGKNTQDAAKAVGVPYITIHSWEKKTGKTTRRKKATKKSSVKRQALKKAVRGKKKPGRKPKAAPKPRGGLTLVTPNGFRIEGISSSELIMVLKALK